MGRTLGRWSGNALTRSRRCVARKPIALWRRRVGRGRRRDILWRIEHGRIGAGQIDAGQPARAGFHWWRQLRSGLGRLGRRVAQQFARPHRRSAHARIGLCRWRACWSRAYRPDAGADDKRGGDGRASEDGVGEDGAADDGAGDTDEGGTGRDDDGVRGRTSPFPLPLGGVPLEFNAVSPLWRHHRLPGP